MTIKPADIIFPNYTQIRQPVPRSVWYAARLGTVGLALSIILLLFIRPDTGLFIFWRLIVPVLPLLFFVAPGLWRNICPMAAVNQTPRLFKFSRAMPLPPWTKEYAYVIGIGLFFLIVPTRKALFNDSGAALGLLLACVFTTAFLGGYFFKGKSGWCSSICPLLPVQRLYGQTPFVVIPNSHCQPCVGCAKNCYDFNPAVANMADHYDKDRHYSGYRKFFAAAFPGLILAFYLVPNPPEIDIPAMYGLILLAMLISVGVYTVLDTFLRVSSTKVTTLFGAAALNLYYAFNLPLFTGALERVFGINIPVPLVGLGHGVILGLTLLWIYRTYQKEALFVTQSQAHTPPIKSSMMLKNSLVLHQSKLMKQPEVQFAPDNRRILAEPGTSLLEIAENNGLHLESGCRMGVCGADPVAILKGQEHLSPPTGDEKTTLERLGFAPNTRMACCARVQGAVTVALKPERASATPKVSRVEHFQYDPAVQKVVIIGNGIAGITAADHIRRRHPLCQIQVVAREQHHLYNRMGLSRLIYGRSAMKGLYLMPESWYDDYQIDCLLNTIVTAIDREQQVIRLADGDTLPYDRLILAMGSASYVPPIIGIDLPGSFVLREADDAIRIRAFAQRNFSRTAVIAGGGLLGLEAAYALHKLGLEVTILERSTTLMRRQLDPRGSYFLHEYLTGLGLEILTEAEVEALEGTGQLRRVRLKDGRVIPADVFLACAGIQSNTDLAAAAGLEVRRGIVVDATMRTSDPHIFAVGDAAEFNGQILGLWTIAVAQAETAAANAVGGQAIYTEIAPYTMLKVAGIDLMSIGQFEASQADDLTIQLEETSEHRYRKLVIREQHIQGAILIGYPRLAPIIKSAIEKKWVVTDCLDALQKGHWDVLEAMGANP